MCQRIHQICLLFVVANQCVPIVSTILPQKCSSYGLHSIKHLHPLHQMSEDNVFSIQPWTGCLEADLKVNVNCARPWFQHELRTEDRGHVFTLLQRAQSCVTNMKMNPSRALRALQSLQKALAAWSPMRLASKLPKKWDTHVTFTLCRSWRLSLDSPASATDSTVDSAACHFTSCRGHNSSYHVASVLAKPRWCDVA